MSTDNEVRLADDVLALLKRYADAEGISIDEAATRAVRMGLEESRWRKLLADGRRYARESGSTEE
jgi:hypothetical protein